MAIPDASLIAAFYVPDDRFHAQAVRWMDTMTESEVALQAPTILLAEAAGAIGRRLGDSSYAIRVVDSLLAGDVITFVPLTRPLAELSARIAATERIRGCDAIYLALAGETNDVLYSFDDEQIERGASVAQVVRPD